MINVFFHAFGTLFATGAGVLLLALVTGVVVIAGSWRLALAGVVLIHLGSASVLVHAHNVPGLVAGGQMMAVVICAAMLAFAGWLQPYPVSVRQSGNWPLRLLALLFVVGAWWFLDPGYILPFFSQAETGLLIWTALCALTMLSFSGSPLIGGIAVLLWSKPLYALAAVLLPGSGLAAVVGIADLVIVLACSYLVLLEPAVNPRSPRALVRALPRLPQPGAARPWGLMRRPLQPSPAAIGAQSAAEPSLQPALQQVAVLQPAAEPADFDTQAGMAPPLSAQDAEQIGAAMLPVSPQSGDGEETAPV